MACRVQDKTINDVLELLVPQARDTDFYPASLERGIRSERALKLALAEMYVQGVSTRKVAKITEELCGFEISSTFFWTSFMLKVDLYCLRVFGLLEAW